jgi:hypothetical protein
MMQLEFGGQRYPITAGESTIGTDPDGVVVLAGAGIRRRHAIIHGSPVGAAIRAAAADATVLVNGLPVGVDLRPVRHGDTVTIGSNDLLVIDPKHETAGAPGEVPPPHAEPALVAPSGATYRLADTMHGMPAAKWQAPTVAAGPPEPAKSPAVLASFLVRTGEHKGRRLSVTRVSVSIGRADYSDLVIGDGSVSAEHARLRRQDGLWMLTDVGSTNGTYVDGERVTDEAPLVAPRSSDALPARVPVRERETSRGVSKWLVAAMVVAAIAGAAVGFVLLR